MAHAQRPMEATTTRNAPTTTGRSRRSHAPHDSHDERRGTQKCDHTAITHPKIRFVYIALPRDYRAGGPKEFEAMEGAKMQESQHDRCSKPLESRTALVTGSSRGLGEATAKALDEAGARVILTGRTIADLERVAAGLGNEPVVIPTDLSEAGAGTRLAEAAISRAGGVDVLVNNAGFPIRGAPEDLVEAELDRILAVNVRSILMLVAGLGPTMIERGRGSIINVSSVASLRGPVGRVAYTATKGAIDAMTRALAADWGPKGVRVNAVNPGIIKTAMFESRQDDMTAVAQAMARRVALGRLGEPRDVAELIAFLASDAAGYITGETITIDGGMVHAMTAQEGSG